MTTVQLTVSDGIAELVLDRPEKLNAVDAGVMAGLAAARDELAAADPRCLLVRGSGRAFCVGADRDLFATGGGLSALTDPALTPAAAADRVGELQRAVVWIAELPYPTVAAVQGHALGLGLQLALLCDLRIAADDASMGVVETTMGVIPDAGGTWLLPRLVGAGRAAAMVLAGERVGAVEAARIGLVNRVVEPGDLLDTARAVAAHLAAQPAAAVREAKHALGSAFTHTFAEGLRAEAEGQVRALRAAASGDSVHERD